MPDRLDRRELRTDDFAVALENNVQFVASHRTQFIRYGAISLAVVAIAAGIYFYRSYQHDVRQEKLGEAIEIQETGVQAGVTPGPLAFPTDQAKRDAANKAFTEVATNYSGSTEGWTAEYYLACIAADAGKLDEARKRYQQVSDNGNKQFGSLAKLALSDMDFQEGKGPEGEKLLKDLMANPTVFVSKDQSTIELARYYAGHNRAPEARALLQPMVSTQNASSQAAVQILGDLSK